MGPPWCEDCDKYIRECICKPTKLESLKPPPITIKGIEVEDTWWNRVKKCHDEYINLHNDQPPNLLIMDEASYKEFLRHIYKEKKEIFFTGDIISVPRCGCSEVHFFHKIKHRLVAPPPKGDPS
jgi:hypothetical protein